MPEPIATYRVRTSGLWTTRHVITGPGLESADQVGVLTVERNPRGVVCGGRYQPAQGEVLVFRRDPGLLRGQFSLWTEGHEWLGSSLRWSILRRDIALHTGNKPLRLVPSTGLAFGWSLQAPKTGEMARIRGNPLTRGARLEVFRKLDFELLVFAYFLGSQIWLESLWPGPSPEGESGTSAPSKASAS